MPNHSARWPFVGRRHHLEAFVGALDDPSCGGVVFMGDTGVGLSRLLQECAAEAEARGLGLEHGTTSLSAQLIPLAALARVLPPDASAASTDNLIEVFVRAQAAFAGEPEGPRSVLVIDDLHLLDETSAALVRHLQATTPLFLLGTVHVDRESTDAVAAVWMGDQTIRLDLAQLDRNESNRLLAEALGGPVDGEAKADLWDAGHGNPLLLRELVAAAVAQGALVPFEGVWRVVDPLPMAGHVSDLILRRLSAMSAEGRALLEDVAVGQPIGLADLERAHSAELIEAAERGGFIVVKVEGHRVDVRLRYRAHLEVLRLDLAPERLHELKLANIQRVEHHGARRRDDPLRLARWYLDGAGPGDPELLLRAANLARGAHDFVTVERMVTASLAARPTVHASRLRGEALYELGSFKEAEVELQRAESLAIAEVDRNLVAATRSTNLFWGLIQMPEALEVLSAAEARATNPAVLHELAARRASISLHSGWPARALDELPELLPGEIRAMLEASMVRSLATALRGGGEAAVVMTDAGFAEHMSLGDFSGIAHPGTQMVNKVVALTEVGRLVEAWDLASAGYEIAVGERVPIAKMWFALQLGRVSLVQGRVATSRQWFREVVAHGSLLGHQHPLRLGLAGVGVSSAYLGDAASATQAADELEAFEGPAYGFFACEMDRARAWAAGLAGEHDSAIERLAASAVFARESGQRTQEAAVLYDAVRLGADPGRFAGRLGELAQHCDGRLIPAWAAQAGAMEAADATALLEVAAELEDIGTLLFAAEATNSAADLTRAAGDQRAATAHANQALLLARSCEGAQTPGLPAQRAAVPLTARERQIAELVAQGLPSREIAERLYLSVRTVQSHLQRIFAKLGVTSRAEVGDALDRNPGEG